VFSASLLFKTAVAAALGYAVGSIPFGLILTRWAGLGDVRAIGSGNIGATNVLRTGSRKVAAATLLSDALKGAAPVILMNAIAGPIAGLIAGVAAFLGHLFPVWLGFKGGKGVATYLGVLFGIAWALGLAFLAVWLAMAFVFKRSSLAALTASALSPLWAWLDGLSHLFWPLAAFAALIWFTHRANIARLLKGDEPPIDLGGKT
jgi:acyl phosphate:glycerol-3-phosphate acyltransferase